MKKIFFLAILCLMALTMQAQTYVDLGLSSGTKWKTTNEKSAADAEYDFFTYDEAVSQFGDRLPSKDQWKELKSECQWSWTGSGYKVIGPNGQSIDLPAAGMRFCNGSVSNVGSSGNYWSSTYKDSNFAWNHFFNSGGARNNINYRCNGFSVRLVHE